MVIETDPELLEAFQEEISTIRKELDPIVKNLSEKYDQPDLFLTFSQIIDRIYGTAMTMGFKELGEYTGVLRNICRKCGHAKFPVAMLETTKMLKRCMENFDTLEKSIKDPEKMSELMKIVAIDFKRAKALEEKVLSFAKPST